MESDLCWRLTTSSAVASIQGNTVDHVLVDLYIDIS